VFHSLVAFTDISYRLCPFD